ncbi:MAG TPA: hypothetical protein VG325_08870 [Solirubrobacteraceae bacterium]|nr:hypothetical protein [Solirubrobacteraceae bacterium]
MPAVTWRRVMWVTMVAVVAVLAVGCGGQAISGPRAVARSSAGAVTSRLGAAAFVAFPAVATDGADGFDAVWTGGPGITTAHWSTAARTWSSATPLSGGIPGQSTALVAGSASGGAAVVWTVGSVDRAPAIQARYRAALSSAWQQTATLYSSGSESVDSPQVGMDDRGDAVAVWVTSGGAIDLAEHPAGAGAWLPRVTVTTDRRAGNGLVFAVSAGGTLALAWEHHLSGGRGDRSRSRLDVKVRPVGSRGWLQTLSLGAEGEPTLQGDASTYIPSPSLASNARGSVFVAWPWPHRGTFYPRAAVLTPDSRWRTPHLVSLPHPGITPVIAGDDRGVATVLWQSYSPSKAGPGELEQADLSPQARLLAIHQLGLGGIPVIAADGTGDVVATWGESTAAFRPAGHRWCPKLSLGRSSEAQVAIAPNGIAQVIWHRESETIAARTLTACHTSAQPLHAGERNISAPGLPRTTHQGHRLL